MLYNVTLACAAGASLYIRAADPSSDLTDWTKSGLTKSM